ncbi:hypothetical protein C8R45DRAFT_1090938 [Mycena sanguinolenta]|nr:hypothetical protein C8R45DRAFT_1090938 [Mycena sanguinolenta]
MSTVFDHHSPKLPPELERRIFEIAALARPIRVRTLMLVTRRLKSGNSVEPILYRVVFLGHSKAGRLRNLGLPTFTADALEQRSPNPFRHVKHLSIDDAVVKQPDLESWIFACTGVTNLYALFNCQPEILPSISGLTNVQYLTIDVRVLCGTTVLFPLFLAITHLELFDFTHAAEENVDRVCRNISLIPRLTHLALNSHLNSSPSIVFLSSLAPLDDSPLLGDDRFVTIHEDLEPDKDWLNGAVFGEDYWALADAFLAARRAGTIPRSLYHIVNEGNLAIVEYVESG